MKTDFESALEDAESESLETLEAGEAIFDRLAFIDALMNFLRLDSQCKTPWTTDVIHNTPNDHLVFRRAHGIAAAGVYMHLHDGFLDIGKFEHAYDDIGSAMFVPFLLIPLGGAT